MCGQGISATLRARPRPRLDCIIQVFFATGKGVNTYHFGGIVGSGGSMSGCRYRVSSTHKTSSRGGNFAEPSVGARLRKNHGSEFHGLPSHACT